MQEEISPKTTSTSKLQANRENAQKSTGPRTTQGKRSSSRNAEKHGLLSKDLVIRSGEGKESRKEFNQLLEELIEDFQPQNRAELSLVETIAICDWRYRRTLRAEAGEIINGFVDESRVALNSVPSHRSIPGADAVSKILRYQTTIHRQKMQALQMLEKLQQRRGNLPPGPASAERAGEEE